MTIEYPAPPPVSPKPHFSPPAAAGARTLLMSPWPLMAMTLLAAPSSRLLLLTVYQMWMLSLTSPPAWPGSDRLRRLLRGADSPTFLKTTSTSALASNPWILGPNYTGQLNFSNTPKSSSLSASILVKISQKFSEKKNRYRHGGESCPIIYEGQFLNILSRNLKRKV